jgi:hypothetical protein
MPDPAILAIEPPAAAVFDKDIDAAPDRKLPAMLGIMNDATAKIPPVPMSENNCGIRMTSLSAVS